MAASRGKRLHFAAEPLRVEKPAGEVFPNEQRGAPFRLAGDNFQQFKDGILHREEVRAGALHKLGLRGLVHPGALLPGAGGKAEHFEHGRRRVLPGQQRGADAEGDGRDQGPGHLHNAARVLRRLQRNKVFRKYRPQTHADILAKSIKF